MGNHFTRNTSMSINLGAVNIEFSKKPITSIEAEAMLVLYCNHFEDIVTKEGKVVLPTCLGAVANAYILN